MGMMGIPDRLEVTPDILREGAVGKVDLYKKVNDYLTSVSPSEVCSISVLLHDTDLLSGTAEEQELFWQFYVNLVRWAANNKNFHNDYEDLFQIVADDRGKEVSDTDLFVASRQITGTDHRLPAYIDLGNDFLGFKFIPSFCKSSSSQENGHLLSKLVHIKRENILQTDRKFHKRASLVKTTQYPYLFWALLSLSRL